MTIDANLLYGFELGFAAGFAVMGLLAFVIVLAVGKCVKLPW